MKKEYKILIIDDEEEILLSLKKNLILEGYNVETCNDSVKALEMIKNNKFHIVITDIVMPNMNGIDLLKAAKSYDALTQVIMMTGYSTMEITIQSLEFGANDYILKPFKSIEYIIEIIDYSIQKLERWRESIRGLVAK
ncbi:response regulator [Clostridium beijerinckii]|uniref:Stage 0 sporulation protein A homolog n=1 Tax=Clostridium beijerinckii TaxID=1520 RepID=A0A1B9BHL9_CLOBE|nr:response regulator [Clostridium beijerinckii]AQS07033.1 response regulator MprA [Clostridium beijerinckii]MBA2883529.1 DNA-binding NtrC family response regulator [Clostridium beijerinckii]MBA2898716.1 DNA-binding NtrC family response regulator [Clostridium beijerinckii]MBA2908116.1 DNA-binding NtrC family response regulator [Clostridium beijerinckii]MBA9013336.1 DNA-binding NtrC family response regulator [Clostridium beijerinckii]